MGYAHPKTEAPEHFCSMLESRSKAVLITDQCRISCPCAKRSKRQ